MKRKKSPKLIRSRSVATRDRLGRRVNRVAPVHRNLRLESLDQRIVFTSFVDLSRIGLSDNSYSPRDDAVVVAVGSDSQAIDVLNNDWQWGPYISLRTQSFDDDAAPGINGNGAAETLPNLALEEAEASLEVGAAQNGTVSLSSDGKVLYTPAGGFEGIDRFTYSVEADGERLETSVYVNVIDPIYAMQDWFRVDEDSTGKILDVLRNDQLNSTHLLGQGHTGEFTIVSVNADDEIGVVEIDADSSKLIYSPKAGIQGLQTIQYMIEDNLGYRSTASVQIQVTTFDDSSSQPAWLEQAKQRLLEHAVENRQSSFGQSNQNDRAYRYWDDFYRTDTLRTADLLSTTDDAASFSLTNNQESGVDEADLVKTDGDYLYIVSSWVDTSGGTHDQLVISDVRDPLAPQVISRYELDGRVDSLLMVGDRVVVLTQNENSVTATVLDVTDRSDPTFVYDSTLRGRLDQTRAIGDSVYFVTQSNGGYLVPGLERHCFREDVGCFFETAAQYAQRIGDTLVESVLPTVETRLGDTEVATIDSTFGTSVDFDGEFWQLQASTIVSLDVSVDGEGAVDALTFVSDLSTEIYVSESSIYLLSRGSEFQTDRPSTDRGNVRLQTTGIEKIDLGDSGVLSWSASGLVRGHLLNEFSVDEHQGHLRIATIEGVSSSVHVLTQDGFDLEVVGSVEDIAPDELLYAVRFEGGRGYVVTFRQVDPLFVLDLSEPDDPRLVGELKIPGFSNYLHIIDENHVLGIGRNANIFGRYQEMQVSLFDVSDMENPIQKHLYSFEGGRDLWSPLMNGLRSLGSHRSVNYFGSHQTLVMPVYETNAWTWSPRGSETEVSMRVLDIDIEDGITALGSVDFQNPFKPDLARSVRIGDLLYSVSPDLVKVTKLRDPSDLLSEFQIGAGAQNDSVVTRGDGGMQIDVLENDGTSGGEVIFDVEQPDSGGTVRVLANQEIEFMPDPGFVGEAEFNYVIEMDGATTTASVHVEVKRSWHNAADPFDVNQDDSLTSRDALHIINALSRYGTQDVDAIDALAIRPQEAALMFDVNNDGRVTAGDALRVINQLGRLGEPADLSSPLKQTSFATSDVFGSPQAIDAAVLDLDDDLLVDAASIGESLF